MTDHIVIGDIRPRIQYTADGTQTDFTYPFPIFAAADLKVYVGDALQAGGYTVAGAGQSAGGSVSFAAAPAAGAVVTLLRALAIARSTDFQEGGALRAKTLNDELDRQTAFIQEAAERIERALVAPPTESAAPLVLPPPAARANALLGFDAAGAPIAAAGNAVAIAAPMLPLVQAADAAAARAALGLGTAATLDHGAGDDDLPRGAQSRLARVAESVKTADYALAASDAGAMLIANKATAIAFTLPAAATLGLGFAFMARNIGAGDLTLDPAGAETIDGTATLALKQNEAALVWTDGTLWRANIWRTASKTSYALLRDEKTDGTDGGSATAGSWNVRAINMEVSDADSIVSLIGSNQFRLIAGAYKGLAWAPFTVTGQTRIRLWNVTAGTSMAISGTVGYGTTNHQSMIPCLLPFQFNLSAPADFRIEYYCSANRATDGLGAHDGASLGVEAYTHVQIERIG